MQEGKDTDLAVAQACGIHAEYAHLSGGYHCVQMKHEGGIWGPFCPSTDLNDAFVAAEKCRDDGLFKSFGEALAYEHTYLSHTTDLGYGGGWNVVEEFGVQQKVERTKFLSRGEATPALAICAAIIALKPVITIYPDGAD